MNHRQREKPHILFLFSDTGGGHRSAAEAIIEAIELEFPGTVSMEMVDLFREYAPPPLDMAPDIYPPLSRVPEVWELGYRMSDGRRRTRLFNDVFWTYIRRASQRLVKDHPCDMIVSVHPLLNTPVRRSVANKNIPFATVVTDMVSVHAFWYDNRADLIVVATEAARQRGLEMGVPSNRMAVAGLPVADRFCQPPGDRNQLRTALGWPLDKPTILLVGGGDGMGPLQETAGAIDEAELPANLVVVCGRNKKLQSQLESHQWKIPVKVYGFVREMPDFMRAADILVTKAGPGTICEAFIAGLPIILYSRMPGQEDGNVAYVVSEGAGVWAPKPVLVVETLRRWLENPEEKLAAAEVCRRLARPQAARQIGRLLVQKVGISAVTEQAGAGQTANEPG